MHVRGLFPSVLHHMLSCEQHLKKMNTLAVASATCHAKGDIGVHVPLFDADCTIMLVVSPAVGQLVCISV